MTESTAHYLTPPAELRAIGLIATGVGRIVGQTTSRVNRVLPCYAGVLVTAGSGRLALGSRQSDEEVRAGAFFWLPPGIPHTYGPEPGTWSEYWLLFEGPATACYEDFGFLSGGPSVVQPDDPRAIHDSFVRLLELGGRSESLERHLAASAAVHSLISAVGTVPCSRTPPRPSRHDIGRRALHLLARDFDQPVSINSIARELAVSRDTLAVAVREVTGSTPSDFLTRYRLNRAKSLLAETDLPVAQVAHGVGYRDAAYFTRAFTRNTGVPPSVFRRQQGPQGAA
ncbi:AraC family transcriptional regulator [Streptacidiphilus sp. P02-A3a]|uniref:AraC family transcriptional regulator n=1 Tax=Streptacidiphilus sp. P02-A3a TaxID=2704468 RepID=UPI0015FA682D|nr:AraC family transcriptional regulator [Streptacidiphilus sp. P02-A3a]QMU71689.1 AraC family transcriptional regulator [Streptacidiphilus sp. P02-A3a]